MPFVRMLDLDRYMDKQKTLLTLGKQGWKIFVFDYVTCLP